MVGNDVKQAAMNRVFGFEIMPAPFVIAHLQLGLVLQAQGLPLSHKRDERVGVYLTNALTGWDPPKGPKQKVAWAELGDERDAAEHVKRDKKILVVLGNPPYNAFAGISPEEEQGLVEPYKKDLNKPTSAGGWGIKKFNLDDLYVRFFRLAERRIAEMSGKGVVSFISNFSYLSDPSFVVMRQRFLAEFDTLWFDCMNGDSRETGKLTPDGKPDPSVFSTEYNREGIRVGTAVCVIVRKPTRQKKPTVRFRQFWGANKRAELLASLTVKRFNKAYPLAKPRPENRFSFQPENVAAHYADWPKLTEFCAVVPFNGLMEKRGGALIAIDRNALQSRMHDYFDSDLSWDEYKARQAALTEDAARCNAKDARAKTIAAESFDVGRLRRYTLRPLEARWCYYTAVRPVWNEPRPSLWAQCWDGNRFLMTRPAGVAAPEGVPFCFTGAVGDNDALRGHAYYIPLLLKNGSRLEKEAEATLFAALGDKPEVDEPVANLSAQAREYLRALKLKNPDADARTASLIWMHSLAVGYSPAYLSENADGIRRDWPRIPLPTDRKILEASAALGEQIAALLDTETDVPGVTSRAIAPTLRTVGVPSTLGGGEMVDLAVTAGWGHFGKDSAVMPAKGKLDERQYDGAEAKAIDAEAAARSMAPAEVRRLLGETTCDVFLNETAYWRNLPRNVWEYTIGGYQVIKKWLSYREQKILGRALKAEEVREVMNMARRIAGIILLQPKLDENYSRVKAATFDWPAS